MLSLLFLNVHADSPKPTSQDCPGSHGTNGNLGARIFFRKQGFISFICFQKNTALLKTNIVEIRDYEISIFPGRSGPPNKAVKGFGTP
jgi:hypothetical protein